MLCGVRGWTPGRDTRGTREIAFLGLKPVDHVDGASDVDGGRDVALDCEHCSEVAPGRVAERVDRQASCACGRRGRPRGRWRRKGERVINHHSVIAARGEIAAIGDGVVDGAEDPGAGAEHDTGGLRVMVIGRESDVGGSRIGDDVQVRNGCAESERHRNTTKQAVRNERDTYVDLLGITVTPTGDPRIRV